MAVADNQVMGRYMEFTAGIIPERELPASQRTPQHRTRIEAVGDKHVPVCERCGPVGGRYDTPGEAVQGSALHQRNQIFSPRAHHDPYDDDWN